MYSGSALGDLIIGNVFLAGTFKTLDLGITLLSVFFTNSTIHPLAPAPKTTGFQTSAHQVDYFLFR